ncbi:phospho-N-acetylmuramoyl-pentapeptide-transferase [Clostridia bacterium]|nr:phospho-N-acetylmuramoyl-pentapeptide-transferase [Clostridia bacterium]
MFYIAAPLALSLLISFLLGRVLIPVLKSKKLGQKILDIGPRWHKSKEGTPLMGGLLFIFGTLAAILIFGLEESAKTNHAMLFTYLMAFGFGLIGFIDDYIKLFKKQNQGMSVVGKLALQFPLAIAYVIALRLNGIITTELLIPFANITVDMGIYYYILIVLGIVYFVNSANFADGIDGLCGSVTAIIMAMFVVMFFIFGDNSGLIIASACFGGLIGFLYFNFYPAKVFMGDTGSQFLGGMVTGLAIWLNIPLLLIIFGLVYVIESLSVVIQVTSFKLTGKRVFKMSPIHHHFEMCGWKETKIVAVACVITTVLSVVSVISLLT